ncbi:MAG: heavy metal-responsive transcriptional regulator [Verrucomicrobia bacterium]|nr:heavy metal-responsive transcriptional regulator [Verrucomicrobiota bacterium]
MKPESLLKVGELAARVGVGVQTLHYYERLGLLPPPNRSGANYRLYPPEALRRVRFIKKAQALGFALERIQEILYLHDHGSAPCHRIADLAQSRLQELDAQLAVLRTFRRSLAAGLPKWEKETAQPRQCAGEFCDLIEHLPIKSNRPAVLKKSKKSL